MHDIAKLFAPVGVYARLFLQVFIHPHPALNNERKHKILKIDKTLSDCCLLLASRSYDLSDVSAEKRKQRV